MLENKLKALLIIIFLILFISCNLIISNPHTRENPNDPDAEISKFYAFAVDTDEIITTWQWNDNNHDSDERIEEILIMHSADGYPEVLVPFSGESITNSSKSEFKWKDLEKNTTHYFALHMKDERDRWYAPLFAKAELPGTLKSSLFGFTKSMQVGDGGPPYIHNIDTGIIIRNDGPPNSCLVVKLDIPDDIYVISAVINTGEGIDTSIPLRVFPVERSWDQDPNNDHGYWQLTDSSIDDYVVDDSVSAFISSTDPFTNDITEVVQKALQYNTKQIVFKIDESIPATSANVDLFKESFINIDYYTN